MLVPLLLAAGVVVGVLYVASKSSYSKVSTGAWEGYSL